MLGQRLGIGLFGWFDVLRQYRLPHRVKADGSHSDRVSERAGQEALTCFNWLLTRGFSSAKSFNNRSASTVPKSRSRSSRRCGLSHWKGICSRCKSKAGEPSSGAPRCFRGSTRPYPCLPVALVLGCMSLGGRLKSEHACWRAELVVSRSELFRPFSPPWNAVAQLLYSVVKNPALAFAVNPSVLRGLIVLRMR